MSSKLEKFAVINILCSFPNETKFYHKGWKQFIRDLIDDLTEEDKIEIDKELALCPDLWTYDIEKKIITVVEVENTSLLNVRKLQKYFLISEYIRDVDNDWRISLFVSDRYGLNLTEIPHQTMEFLDLINSIWDYVGKYEKNQLYVKN